MALTQGSHELGVFLDALASADPIPGGGSAAALSGSVAAALVCMVCRVTIEKKGDASIERDLSRVLDRAEEMRRELAKLIQLDGEAYARVLEAYRLPKGDAARSRVIQGALMDASSVPIQIAKSCAELLACAHAIADKPKKNVSSDLRVAAILAQAGLQAAIVTAESNLAVISDEEFVRAQRRTAADLVATGAKRKQEILEITQAR